MAQVVVAVATQLAFFAWAPWMAAEPISNFAPEIAAKLPPNCPAVSVNHGNYTCEWRGTSDSSPWKFGALSLVVFGGVAFVIISSMAGRGFAARKKAKQ